MSIESVGNKIALLRKEKGVTQDELARTVCVSAQAVSKWENGGVPDIELLPKIADFFGISIDTLFGRNIVDYSDVENALSSKIVEIKHEKLFDTIFDVCWTMEKSVFGHVSKGDTLSEIQSNMKNNEQSYSSILDNHGYTRMGLGNRLKYFLIVPEVEDKETAFFNGIDYPALFKDLSDRQVFDTLVMLNKRESKKSFTPNLLVRELGVEFEKAIEIINILRKYGLIETMQIEMDDITHEAYKFIPTPSYTAMLIFAREIIDKPNVFSYFSGGRNKSYL